MKIWLCENLGWADMGWNNSGFEVFDAIVIAAKTEEAARAYRPTNPNRHEEDHWPLDQSLVRIKCLGEAAPDIEAGYIIGSYNAT